LLSNSNDIFFIKQLNILLNLINYKLYLKEIIITIVYKDKYNYLIKVIINYNIMNYLTSNSYIEYNK